ncbi:MAG: leucyl aminopeptidase [Bacteroidetes bacterium]|nr:MAG: leucyl aminopeptidase [Bacteroidota bacterium]
MQISLSKQPLPGFPTLFPVFQDDHTDARLSQIAAVSGLEKSVLESLFRGEAKETLPLPGSSGTLWLLGLGKKTGFREVRNALRSFSHRNKSRLPEGINIDIQGIETHAEAMLNGFLLGLYELGQHKTEEKKPLLLDQINLVSEAESPDIQSFITRAELTAASQIRVYDLVNAPANFLRPEDLGVRTTELGTEAGFSVRVLDKAALEAEGLGALLSVGRGSEFPPVLIVAEYTPELPDSESLPLIALVGKGVTFDTGGLSIKPSTNMHWMKSDMAGAAAVIGTMDLVARLKLPVRLLGVIPATENCVDSHSVKPGDIIRSYSGKTIEVIDTDAEGRLILADAVSYAIKNYQPDVMVDLATLTGNCILALGYHAAGLFTQNETLASRLSAAGDICGERVWRLPLWDSYEDELNSDMADVKNLSGKPVAGAITAAKFIEAFTGKHPAWVHLDIAGVAFSDSEFASQRSATAWGVKLLSSWIEGIAAGEKPYI